MQPEDSLADLRNLLVTDALIDDLMYGRLSLEEALARHPSRRAELEPMLRAALALGELKRLRAPDSLRVARRARLMAMIARSDATPPTRADRATGQPMTPGAWPREGGPAQPAATHPPLPSLVRPTQLGAPGSGLGASGRPRAAGAFRRGAFWLRPVAAVLALGLVLGAGVTASAHTLPGDPLYPARVLAEQAQLTVVQDDRGRAELHLRFAARRLEDLEARRTSLAAGTAERAGDDALGHLVAAEQLVQKPAAADLRPAVATQTASWQRITVQQAPSITVVRRSGTQSPRADVTAAVPAVTAGSAVAATPEPRPYTATTAPVLGKEPALSAAKGSDRRSETAPGQSTTMLPSSTPPGLARAPQDAAGPSPASEAQRATSARRVGRLIEAARSGSAERAEAAATEYVREIQQLRREAERPGDGGESEREDVLAEIEEDRRALEAVLPNLPSPVWRSVGRAIDAARRAAATPSSGRGEGHENAGPERASDARSSPTSLSPRPSLADPRPAPQPAPTAGAAPGTPQPATPTRISGPRAPRPPARPTPPSLQSDRSSRGDEQRGLTSPPAPLLR
ncbi:MAG: hypothetical protein HYY04_14765 [Chloroflexi bacterium]|nr:hypothetical protein [Chloroflexota bacterium]